VHVVGGTQLWQQTGAAPMTGVLPASHSGAGAQAAKASRVQPREVKLGTLHVWQHPGAAPRSGVTPVAQSGGLAHLAFSTASQPEASTGAAVAGRQEGQQPGASPKVGVAPLAQADTEAQN